MKKKDRHAILLNVIKENKIKNQNMLVDYLNTHNFPTTQATVSRDIRELNITKKIDEQGDSYFSLPISPSEQLFLENEDKLTKFLSEPGITITQVEFITIIHTSPGNGQIIGILIDAIRSEKKEIVACLAGDDTILIISSNKETAKVSYEYFMSLIQKK